MITVRPSHRGGPGGRGVFASRAIQTGELLDEDPVIIVPRAELESLEGTVLANYYYAWGEGFLDGAFALGLGSLFNHDDDPSARFERDLDAKTIRFYAKRDVEAGEEITISYRTTFPDEPLRFDAK